MKENKMHQNDNPESSTPISQSRPGECDWINWEDLFYRLRATSVRKIRAKYQTLSKEDAEEIADEAITRLYANFDQQKLNGVATEDQPRILFGYINKVLLSAVSDFFKQRPRTDTTASGDSSGPRLSTSESKISAQTVQTCALNTLTKENRDLLHRRFVDEWTFAEIHEYYCSHYRRSLTESAVKMKIIRARQQIERSLKEDH